MDACLSRREADRLNSRRRATEAEEEWLDMMVAEEEERQQQQQPPPEQQQQQTPQQEAMRLDEVERYQKLEDLQQGSMFFLRSELAERTPYSRLLAIRSSATQLVSIVDQTLYKSIQSERDAARRQLDDIQKEIEKVVSAERSQLEGQISQLKDNQEDLLHLLEEEQERMNCRICFGRSRDVILLPCMHFDYCDECIQQHQARNSTCPTCRGPISGALKCNLSF